MFGLRFFGAFAFASVGGVFGGLAEAEEDRATRLVAVDPRPYRALTADFTSAEARRAALQRLLGD